jgi:phosphoglycerate kinase
MNLKSVELVPEKSTVILRLDLDLPIVDGKIIDNSRLIKSLPTISLLLAKSCQLVIIGHLGRPETKDDKFSLKPVYLELLSLLSINQKEPLNSIFLEDPSDPGPLKLALSQNQVIFVENLRFWPDETLGSFVFLQSLIDQSQAFVNDAIAAYHPATSINLYHVLPGYYGLSFLEEIKELSKFTTCLHPFTIILGGAKMDKLDYLPALINLADHVLIGGKLPTQKSSSPESEKIYWASLTPDSFDIDAASIAHFRQIIDASATIIWSGALGFYENPAFRTGTIEVAKSIALSAASFKVIAGGDTAASIKDLGMLDKINFVCSGGGVLLEYLTKGTLPALE